MIRIGEYTKLFATIIIGLGCSKCRSLVFFLALMRVITAGWMLRHLRYSVPVIFHRGRHHDAHRRYPEHVSVRGSDDGTVRHQYRRGMAGRSAS